MEYLSDSDEEQFNENFDEQNNEIEQLLGDMFNNNIITQINANSIDTDTSLTNEFTYPGLHLLNNDFTDVVNNYETGNIHICAYQINNKGLSPFLQFILRKYSKEHESNPDLLTFPSFKYIKTSEISLMCKYILGIIFACYNSSTDLYKYKGYLNIENDIYMFYDCSEYSINNHNLYRTNDLWLVLMDEIINHNKICNFSIDEMVTQFFLNNTEFLYLKNADNINYEMPSVAYSGSHKYKLEFISVFGVEKTINYNLADPHFFFTNYVNAINMGGWIKNIKDKLNENNECPIEYYGNNNKISDKSGKYTYGGINRFALFLGKMKVNNDTTDGVYNSIYINNESPIWAVPTYEQQLPLTCHYIDKNGLTEFWDKNVEYFIL
jgi:hypothetical protein